MLGEGMGVFGQAGAQPCTSSRVMKARHRPQALWWLADYSPVQQQLPGVTHMRCWSYSCAQLNTWHTSTLLLC
jgi:hypothetical protein